MPGKYSDGFIKAAQKQKFVRHRDLKMKESELKRERHIQKVMCEGICKRCRDKVQWRFQFDKYKPLKNPATCQECKQKTVTKAYRTLCDGCAQKKNVCPSCCGDMALLLAAEEAEKKKRAAAALKEEQEQEAAAAASAIGSATEVPTAGDTKPSGESAGMEVEAEGFDEEGDEEEDGEGGEEEEEGDDMEEEDEEENEGPAVESEEIAGFEQFDETSIPAAAVSSLQWNEQKFRNISASKYSKTRVPGQEF